MNRSRRSARARPGSTNASGTGWRPCGGASRSTAGAPSCDPSTSRRQAQCVSSTRMRPSRCSCRSGIGHAGPGRARSTATRRGCGCSSPMSPPPPRSPCTTTDSRCGRPSRSGTWGTRPTRCGCTSWPRRRPKPTPRCGTRCSRSTLRVRSVRSSYRSTIRCRTCSPTGGRCAPRRVNDGLWLNLRDVKRCFEARTYGTDDDIVVEADGIRWRIGAGGCAGCAAARPQTDHASLSALLLGGVRPSALVAGRRMTARNADARSPRRCAVHDVAGAVLPDRLLTWTADPCARVLRDVPTHCTGLWRRH